MSGIILNVTELKSNLNCIRSRQNDVKDVLDVVTAQNIDKKQNKTHSNGAINAATTSDIHLNRCSANKLDYGKTAEAEMEAEAEVTTKITKHRTSMADSLGSNKMSIVTLDDQNDDDDDDDDDYYDNGSVSDGSSVIDSDSDVGEFVPSQHHSNLNESLPSSGIMMMDKNLDIGALPRHSSIWCANNDIKPNIGSIAVQNSSDITFGNKTFYQGPVTIKQFVYDKNNKWKETELPPPESVPGNDNFGSKHSSTDKLSRIQMENIDQHNEVEKKWRCTSKQSLYGSIFAGILVCSLLALIVIIKYSSSIPNRDSSVLHIGDGDDSRMNDPIKTNIASAIITDTAGPLRIVTRKEWVAQPPSNKLESLDVPVSRVIIAHTATENCTTQAECTYQVRFIQTFHIESRGWDDIGYNFLVGGDGAIYVGRGWDTEGAHTKGFNRNSICFAFIGTFNTVKPPKRQLVAVQKMIVEGVKLKKLTADYGLYGHRQFMSTQSPGSALYEIIQKWDHWTPKDDVTH